MLSVDHLTVNNYVRVNPFFLSWMNINVEFKKKKKSVTFGNCTTVLYIKVLIIELIFLKSLPLALLSHRHFFFFLKYM